MTVGVIWAAFTRAFQINPPENLAGQQMSGAPGKASLLKRTCNSSGVSVEAATLTISAYMLCGAAGMFVGGFVAAFLFAEIISLGGLFSDLEWGYVLAFAFFIVMMFIRPAGLLARRQ